MKKGKHLLLDIFLTEPDVLTDKKFTRELFKNIIGEINMKAILPITIYQFLSYQNKKKKQTKLGGITAFCLLEESHLSCHTWPEENYVAYDIYSCKNFNEKKVINLLRRVLPVKKINYRVIRRP